MGISINTVGKVIEFTLHVRDEYDYRFIATKPR